MRVRVGVSQAKEIELEMAEELEPADLRKEVESVLGDESSVLWLTDRKGRVVGIPAAKVAYVEIDHIESDRSIGFGSGGYS